MHVDAAAALAPVLARFSIVVHGPLEAEVVGRLVSGGDRAVPLQELARPLTTDPSLSRGATVALVRAVTARLVAGGSVEHVGGGFRLADPTLAATLRRLVDAMAPPSSSPASPSAPTNPAPTPPVAPATPVAVEEVSRVLQTGLVARSSGLPVGRPAPAPVLPAAWARLSDAGWRTVAGDTPATGPVLVAGADVGRRLHVVVADPHAPPAVVASRLGGAVEVRLTHLPASAVRWGEGDHGAARALVPLLAEAVRAGGRTVVVDRALVPPLALLVHDGAPLPTTVVDLRSPVGRPLLVPPAEVATPSSLAAAMAGAAGAVAPSRRPAPRRDRRRATTSLLEVLFGPRFADAAGPSPADAPGAGDGLVVTARAEDEQADALAELLGVEVVHLHVGDDLTPEVLAYLEDEDGSRLLAPFG